MRTPPLPMPFVGLCCFAVAAVAGDDDDDYVCGDCCDYGDSAALAI